MMNPYNYWNQVFNLSRTLRYIKDLIPIVGVAMKIYLYRSICIIATWRSLSKQLLAAMLRTIARPYFYNPSEYEH